jgi:hypothetical protein
MVRRHAPPRSPAARWHDRVGRCRSILCKPSRRTLCCCSSASASTAASQSARRWSPRPGSVPMPPMRSQRRLGSPYVGRAHGSSAKHGSRTRPWSVSQPMVAVRRSIRTGRSLEQAARLGRQANRRHNLAGGGSAINQHCRRLPVVNEAAAERGAHERSNRDQRTRKDLRRYALAALVVVVADVPWVLVTPGQAQYLGSGPERAGRSGLNSLPRVEASARISFRGSFAPSSRSITSP